MVFAQTGTVSPYQLHCWPAPPEELLDDELDDEELELDEDELLFEELELLDEELELDELLLDELELLDEELDELLDELELPDPVSVTAGAVKPPGSPWKPKETLPPEGTLLFQPTLVMT